MTQIEQSNEHWAELSDDQLKAATPGLVDALTHESNDVRASAIDVLRKMGVAAAAIALPELREKLKDERPIVRWSAAGALAVLGPEARSAVPTLGEMLSDGDEYVRASAAFALGQIGPDAKAAVPHLIEALKYKYVYYNPGYVRTGYLPETVLALAKIGRAAVPALIGALRTKGPGLLGNKALKKQSADVRCRAAMALAEIGPDAEDAIPDLVKAAKDRSWSVRFRAAQALLKVRRGEAKSAWSVRLDTQLAKLTGRH